jgi:hypothetical protein
MYHLVTKQIQKRNETLINIKLKGVILGVSFYQITHIHRTSKSYYPCYFLNRILSIFIPLKFTFSHKITTEVSVSKLPPYRGLLLKGRLDYFTVLNKIFQQLLKE